VRPIHSVGSLRNLFGFRRARDSRRTPLRSTVGTRRETACPMRQPGVAVSSRGRGCQDIPPRAFRSPNWPAPTLCTSVFHSPLAWNADVGGGDRASETEHQWGKPGSSSNRSLDPSSVQRPAWLQVFPPCLTVGLYHTWLEISLPGVGGHRNGTARETGQPVS